MSFGFENGSVTLKRVKDVILATVNAQFVIFYLHDIIIFSKTILEHVNHVLQLVQLLSDAGITFELKKCWFFTDTVDCLVHIIRPCELKFAGNSSDAIHELKEPHKGMEDRSFLGFCIAFRRLYSSSLVSSIHLRKCFVNTSHKLSTISPTEKDLQ